MYICKYTSFYLTVGRYSYIKYIILLKNTVLAEFMVIIKLCNNVINHKTITMKNNLFKEQKVMI